MTDWSRAIKTGYTMADAAKLEVVGDTPLENATIARLPTAMATQWFGAGGSRYVPVRFGVDGSGSCFFFSIAAALNSEDFHSHSGSDQLRIGRNLRKAFALSINKDSWQKAEGSPRAL